MNATIELLGWVGSLLLLVSLAQSDIRRLYLLNGVAAVALLSYNGIIGVWSAVALNIGVIGVNLWRLRHLSKVQARQISAEALVPPAQKSR